jgi:hypothetical protein
MTRDSRVLCPTIYRENMEVKVTSALVGALVALCTIGLFIALQTRSKVVEINEKVAQIQDTLNSAEITK